MLFAFSTGSHSAEKAGQRFAVCWPPALQSPNTQEPDSAVSSCPAKPEQAPSKSQQMQEEITLKRGFDFPNEIKKLPGSVGQSLPFSYEA